mmetsp:Transcript_34932/g.84502  ORF Transcript_34932/g.84502 Transcript_34932/m.84502 type:complete len:291 (+) Transcript_34932:79-951(+)
MMHSSSSFSDRSADDSRNTSRTAMLAERAEATRASLSSSMRETTEAASILVELITVSGILGKKRGSSFKQRERYETTSSPIQQFDSNPVKKQRLNAGKKYYVSNPMQNNAISSAIRAVDLTFRQPVVEAIILSVKHVDDSKFSVTHKGIQLDPNNNKVSKRPIACVVCGKGFRTLALVNRHMMIHSGERPYPCDQCPRRFRQRAHLKKHIRLHTGEKPFKCPHCASAFTQKSTLTGHIRTKHTFERPYCCPGCTLKFPTRNHLRAHRLKCDREQIQKQIHYLRDRASSLM